MSRTLPRFIFNKCQSTFEILFFNIEFVEISGNSEKKIVAELMVNVVTGESKISGKGVLENIKILPLHLYSLSEDERNKIIKSDYVGYTEHFLSMFTHSKVNKIIRNANTKSYLDYFDWLNNNLVGK